MKSIPLVQRQERRIMRLSAVTNAPGESEFDSRRGPKFSMAAWKDTLEAMVTEPLSGHRPQSIVGSTTEPESSPAHALNLPSKGGSEKLCGKADASRVGETDPTTPRTEPTVNRQAEGTRRTAISCRAKKLTGAACTQDRLQGGMRDTKSTGVARNGERDTLRAARRGPKRCTAKVAIQPIFGRWI